MRARERRKYFFRAFRQNYSRNVVSLQRPFQIRRSRSNCCTNLVQPLLIVRCLSALSSIEEMTRNLVELQMEFLQILLDAREKLKLRVEKGEIVES